MGLFPGKEKMPTEEKLFNKIVEEFNFDRKYALKCIEDLCFTGNRDFNVYQIAKIDGMYLLLA